MSNGFFRFEANPAAGMQPSDFTPPETFTTSDTNEVIHYYFKTDDDSILTGVWESAPCKQEIEAYPVHELMTVISGSVTLTGADGISETFTAGDTFFVAKGTPLTWEITQTLRKFYLIASG